VNTEKATAVFENVAGGVKVTVALQECSDGFSYPVHIHQGTSCDTIDTQGAHWGTDMLRGEGIPPITNCANGAGSTTFTRPSDAAANLLWTIGGDAATNVVGHVLVVHYVAPDNSTPRIACGPITLVN
jgi:Cu/Zn superoxide dismutase